MSKEKLSKGEKKVIKAGLLDIKGAVEATGLSYGYCRKVLSHGYIQDAINKAPDQQGEEEKVDKRIGNQFWKARSKHGKDKTFSTPALLWESACEYFQWCEDNPWSKGKSRPYTIGGLCLFLDISEEGFNVYGKKDTHKDYFGIVSKIKSVIYTQKFEGAAVGEFKENIISRDLGLKDKKELSGGLSVISMDDKDKNA